MTPDRTLRLHGRDRGPRHDGVGTVNGGGATAVLLKDYPEPQRSEILDLLFLPRWGASVTTMLVEVPGDGNATQGSSPSHRRTRDDDDPGRGYTWWILAEARRRNPALVIGATAWSAPGWVGDGRFGGQDAADYYVSWLEGLRSEHGIEIDALGCRNERGVDLDLAVRLRRTLDARGFGHVVVHGFDNWAADKFDVLDEIAERPEVRAALGAFSAHVLAGTGDGDPVGHATEPVRRRLAELGLPLWNTEDHVYREGFDALVGIVRAIHESYLFSGATRTVLWYDVAGVYPVEPYAEDPPAILARAPWGGGYRVREALWGYAHHGQFTEVGWRYLEGGCVLLAGGGSVLALASDGGDWSVVVETGGARGPQVLALEVDDDLARGDVCVWRSTAAEQMVRLDDVAAVAGRYVLRVEPDAVYSVSTTRGQRRGGVDHSTDEVPFPFPYRDSFHEEDPASVGYLPRYTADIAGVFELVEHPDRPGTSCVRQAVPAPTSSWAPDWHPYTILGDLAWEDYEVAVDVRLDDEGEAAAVLARVRHVGTGFGIVPRCYLLELGSDGAVRLVAVDGEPDPGVPVGDGEQQALARAGGRSGACPGGERELACAVVTGQVLGRWRRLTLRCEGTSLTGLVDDVPVVVATDDAHAHGQVGLLARGPEIDDPHALVREGRAAAGRTSRPFFAELTVTEPGRTAPTRTVLPPRAPLR